MAALAFLTMTSSCASDEVQADTTVDPELQMELDRCEEACVKRTCNPLYEPEPNLLQLCSESCTEIVRCATEYQQFASACPGVELGP